MATEMKTAKRSKHTPGPWGIMQKLPQRDYTKPLEIVADNELCYPLAEVAPQPRPGQAEANARLIAAAPELLEALREAQPYIDYLADSGNQDAIETMLAINAAITKAEAAT